MKLSLLYDDPMVKAVLEEAERKDQERLAQLTPTQRAILPLICDGQPNKVAAHELGISQRTLENHRAQIMERTSSKTFAELVRLHARAG
jgi:two-component system, chemotaxis family, CheB/CheR fusion protein